VSIESTCDFLLVINSNFGLSPTVFEILTFCFPTPALFDAPAWGNPVEFLEEIYPAKTRGTGAIVMERYLQILVVTGR